jgi:hypothetical protein
LRRAERTKHNCEDHSFHFYITSHKPKNIRTTKTTTMKSTSPSQVPNTTSTRPAALTLSHAIQLSMMASNNGIAHHSQALSALLPRTNTDSPESHAVRHKRLHLILDLAIKVNNDEDEDDNCFNLLNAFVASSKKTSLKRRSLQ